MPLGHAHRLMLILQSTPKHGDRVRLGLPLPQHPGEIHFEGSTPPFVICFDDGIAYDSQETTSVLVAGKQEFLTLRCYYLTAI